MGHTNHLIGPHRALTELNGPHQNWTNNWETLGLYMHILKSLNNKLHIRTWKPYK